MTEVQVHSSEVSHLEVGKRSLGQITIIRTHTAQEELPGQFSSAGEVMQFNLSEEMTLQLEFEAFVMENSFTDRMHHSWSPVVAFRPL